MFNRLSPTYKGIVFGLIGFTAYAFCDICAKFLTPYYSVYQIIATEFGLASLLILAFSKYLGGVRSLRDPRNFKIHAFRIVINATLAVMVTYCFRHLPIASVYIMIFTMPFIAAVLSIPLYQEKVSATRWIAIIIGFSGVAVAFRPDLTHPDPLLILGFLSALLIALLYILSRSLTDPSPFSLGFAPTCGTFIVLLPFMMTHYTPVNPAHIGVFALTGILSATGMMCVSRAFRLAPAAVVSPFLYTEIIWGLIFGYVIFGDIADLRMIAGAALIIASGIFLIETERRDACKN